MPKKTKHKMKIGALQCLKCGDVIYSRANHDCHFCSCRSVMVDAGPGYGRAAGNPEDMKAIQIEIEATTKQLWDDWAHSKNKFGWIKQPNVMERIKDKLSKGKKKCKTKKSPKKT